ncbi:hypothetical protein CC78DRAFT_548588 [Lojkania enalia]|uniref:Uncharacterized protein n=1 Tax=Lojkania enalia TaxID=147567 RepID=A0A9P4MZ51_9PLEO|nr:hypothetical protein CC78DRAFT_548588 [Didymosphaeria enalia]
MKNECVRSSQRPLSTNQLYHPRQNYLGGWFSCLMGADGIGILSQPLCREKLVMDTGAALYWICKTLALQDEASGKRGSGRLPNLVVKTKFTRQEAERLLQDVSVSTWIDITDKGQNQVLDAVNLRLQQMEIPEVTLEILAWRMSRAMWENRKLTETSSRAQSSRLELGLRLNDTPAIPPRTSYYGPARDA